MASKQEPTKINIAEAVAHTLPQEGLLHKGQPVTLSGKVAFEVIDTKTGKRSWCRTLEVAPAKTTTAARKDAPAKRSTTGARRTTKK